MELDEMTNDELRAEQKRCCDAATKHLERAERCRILINKRDVVMMDREAQRAKDLPFHQTLRTRKDLQRRLKNIAEGYLNHRS